ncbi:MAG: hypothetical protein U9R42_05185 [Bacteroidota bacterium]|nr:hypothetical protein [Bacteroidota bacterium]
MKKVFITILLILLFLSSYSCGKAYVNKLYPIGFVKSKLIVVETSLDRFWARDTEENPVKREERTRWKGIILLKELNKNGEFEIIEIVDTIEIIDNRYVDEIRPYFEKAIQKAKSIPYFEIIPEISLTMCNLNKECGNLKLLKQSETTIEIEIGNKKHKNDFTKIFIENSSPSGGILNQNFKIQSIRELELDEDLYLIIHIASGEIHNSQIDLKEEMKDMVFKDI